MASIAELLSNAAQTNANFDFDSRINAPARAAQKSDFEAQDQAFKNRNQDAFKNGVPMVNGQLDTPTILKNLLQLGGASQVPDAVKLDLQRQNIQEGQRGGQFAATGSEEAPQPQAPIVSPPSANRTASAVVAPPLSKGGTSPQGDQGVTPAAFLQQQGIQPGYNMEVGLAAFKRSGIDPDQTFNPNDPAIAARLGPVVQRLKGAGQVQPPQPGDNPPQGQPAQAPAPQPQVAQAAAQVQPPVAQLAPQAPGPFANAIAAGLIPPQAMANPERYVAGLKYRAGASTNEGVKKTSLALVEAINKANELTPTQRDFNASQANPQIDEHALQQKADEARATGVAQSDIKEQDGIISAGSAGRQRLATLNTISNIINTDKNMTLGFGAETALKVKKALESIGVDVGDISGPQAIQKLNGLLASESAKGVSARPAQFEFKTFLTNNPGLDLDKAGNQRVIGIFSQLAKRDVDLGKLARQNRDNWSNWDNVVENYDKQNPIKDPTTGRVITTDSVVAPGPAKEGTTAAAPSTIREGATAFNPKTNQTIIRQNGKWVPVT